MRIVTSPTSHGRYLGPGKHMAIGDIRVPSLLSNFATYVHSYLALQ